MKFRTYNQEVFINNYQISYLFSSNYKELQKLPLPLRIWAVYLVTKTWKIKLAGVVAVWYGSTTVTVGQAALDGCNFTSPDGHCNMTVAPGRNYAH